MSKLNDKNEKTEKVIHLLITEKCDRDCKYCCNKQYDMNTIPVATDEELLKADTICLTGGEPFAHSWPCYYAFSLRLSYHTKNIYVYSNAYELAQYRIHGYSIEDIDGISISIKSKQDRDYFDKYISNDTRIMNLMSNRLYVFDGLYPNNIDKIRKLKNFEVFDREWEEDFKPADDSIFRKYIFKDLER